MPEDKMLQEAIEALQQGQRARARDLLTRLLRADQSNPAYWLWMSSTVDSAKEQVYCLQSALRLDPDNRAAKQGLVLLGTAPAGETASPAPLPRRKWEVPVADIPKRTGFWGNPVVRVVVLSGLSLLFFIIMGVALFSYNKAHQRQVASGPARLTGTPPTFTPTPTFVNFTPQPTSRATEVAGPQPLWMKLAATYTPTPVYVNTPHPDSEAYRVGMRALARGEYKTALSSLQQVLKLHPDAADIYYLMGETYRIQSQYKDAISAYEQGIKANPKFAPSYLGRARARLATSPALDVSDDLAQAISKDSNYAEAYLERIPFYLNRGKLKEAQQDAQKVLKLLPDSPLPHLYLAQIALQQGRVETAVSEAKLANQLDQTLLASYLVLGKASVAGQQYPQAMSALKTYLDYAPQDASGWTALGSALYATGSYTDALQALTKSIGLNPNNPEVYLYRGLIELDLQQVQPAVNDLYVAQRANPSSFDTNLALGRGFLAANMLSQARDQFSTGLSLAQSDAQRAQVYYYRALTIEAIGNAPTALLDWQALLALPAQAVSSEWRTAAQKHIAALTTATPMTPTPTTPAPVPTKTTAPTKTLVPTRTPVPTKTPIPSRTPTPGKTQTATTQPAKPSAAPKQPTISPTP